MNRPKPKRQTFEEALEATLSTHATALRTLATYTEVKIAQKGITSDKNTRTAK